MEIYVYIKSANRTTDFLQDGVVLILREALCVKRKVARLGAGLIA
jgi:hypothetical protein